MRLLLCCESYYPHRGGVQEVMRQLAERFAAKGHDVTVATSRHPKRRSATINGVKVRGFRAGGKMAYGLNGEIDKYRQFVEKFEADAILIMAAQQWSFDALWPVLDKIRARKVFIPCGFSCLYEPDFAEYFRQLPDILRKFDHLVFNAERYRDIDFVRSLGLTNFTVVPNGISEQDFELERDPTFRSRLGISEDDFLFLTVGNPIVAKGHGEVIDAFSRLDTAGRSATLISIADWSHPRALGIAGRGGTFLAGRVRRTYHIARRVTEIARMEGWAGISQLVQRRVARYRASKAPVTCGEPSPPPEETIEEKAAKANAAPLKRVLLTDLPRKDLIQAYMAANLFVFASRVEYSPLVLFEASAAGLPFLTVPVGNADEIVRWTGGGMLCEATKDARGYTRVDPQVLSQEMANCMKAQDALSKLGAVGRERWSKYFTWRVVAGYYEAILSGKSPKVELENSAAAV